MERGIHSASLPESINPRTEVRAPSCGGNLLLLRVSCESRKPRDVFHRMKTRAITCAFILVVAQSAIGQVSTNFLFRNRFPLLNDSVRCDLSPLFAWWAEQLSAKTNGLSPTGRNDGEGNEATNAMDRPMARWVRVTGEILDQNASQGWIVDGMVETAPGKETAMKLILIHPPRHELARFDQQRSLMGNRPPPRDYSAQEALIRTQNNRAALADALGAPDVGDTYAAAAEDARRELERQKERDQAVENERKQSLAALGDFPADWQEYRVDLFAFNTGRQIRGLPAFDAGMSFAH